MLLESKLRSNRRALSICTKIGLLPFQLKDKGRQIDLNISNFHRTRWIVLLIAAVFHAAYIDIRLLETLIWRHEIEFADLGIHIARCVLSTVLTYWAYDGFVSHGGEKAIIYNYTNSPSIQGERNKRAKSFNAFVQDQLVLNCPSMLYPVAFFFVGFSLWKTQSAQFIFAAVPTRWQNYPALIICVLLELIGSLFWLAHAHLFVIYHTPFQQKLELLLDNQLHCNSRCNVLTDLKRKVMIMREVQTALSIHSLGNRRSIFAHKVICIALAIVGFYFFIRLIGVIPVVPFMFLVIGINSICFYSIIWDNAHKIPELMEEMGRDVLRKLPRERSVTKAYLKLELTAMPVCAIQVGSFRAIERNSTLIFTDFESSNLASLLISF